MKALQALLLSAFFMTAASSSIVKTDLGCAQRSFKATRVFNGNSKFIR